MMPGDDHSFLYQWWQWQWQWQRQWKHVYCHELQQTMCTRTITNHQLFHTAYSTHNDKLSKSMSKGQEVEVCEPQFLLTHWGRDKMDATLADSIFKCNFVDGNVLISIRTSLRCVPKGPIDNKSSLVQIMAWRRTGDKPLSEPMVV